MEDKKRLPDSELELMNIIWEIEAPCTRSDIEKHLTCGRELAPSTIITFLTRLTNKGFLQVSHMGRTNYYSPLVSRNEYLAKENRSFIDRLYGGSISAFAVSLTSGGISEDELNELRRLLREDKL